MGLIKAPPANESLRLESLPESARTLSQIRIDVTLADKVQVPWDCVMRDNNLYVDVPANLPIYGSKDSFVSLLEYCEEELNVSHVIVYLRKDRKDRADLVRLFMFMGFTAIPPGLTLLPSDTVDDYIFLAYEAN